MSTHVRPIDRRESTDQTQRAADDQQAVPSLSSTHSHDDTAHTHTSSVSASDTITTPSTRPKCVQRSTLQSDAPSRTHQLLVRVMHAHAHALTHTHAYALHLNYVFYHVIMLQAILI